MAQYKLYGFVENPGTMGFAIPVFKSDGQLYFQQIDTAEQKVKTFSNVDPTIFNTDEIQGLTAEDKHYEARVNGHALYIYQMQGADGTKRLIIDERKKLQKILSRLIREKLITDAGALMELGDFLNSFAKEENSNLKDAVGYSKINVHNVTLRSEYLDAGGHRRPVDDAHARVWIEPGHAGESRTRREHASQPVRVRPAYREIHIPAEPFDTSRQARIGVAATQLREPHDVRKQAVSKNTLSSFVSALRTDSRKDQHTESGIGGRVIR